MKKFLVYALPFFVSSVPLFSFAAELTNPLQFTTLTDFLSAILQVVAQIGFPVIVLYIVFIGFKFVQASGKPEELTKVREMFFWALVGSLIVLGAQVLALAIGETVENLTP